MTQILKSYRLPKQQGIAEGEIVLRKWNEQEWATHFHNLEDGGYYHGHYFNTLEAAEEDFAARVQREVERGIEQGTPVKVPSHVLAGLDEVRKCGTAKLFNTTEVKVQAGALGYPETADWVESNLKLYLEGVFRGFEAGEVEDMTTTASQTLNELLTLLAPFNRTDGKHAVTLHVIPGCCWGSIEFSMNWKCDKGAFDYKNLDEAISFAKEMHQMWPVPTT